MVRSVKEKAITWRSSSADEVEKCAILPNKVHYIIMCNRCEW